MKKKQTMDVLVIGFALFSMFFGAGNLIFPPKLGLQTGSRLGRGLLSVLPLPMPAWPFVTILAMIRGTGSLEGITRPVWAPGPPRLLGVSVFLCLGPVDGHSPYRRQHL